jgi:hypothetical protein
MTSARLLFFLLVISFFASSAFAAGEGSDPQTSNGSVQNQTAAPALFGQPAQSTASDLFFLTDKPHLKFTTPAGQPRSAVLNDADCYTMRTYKVKRQEHFVDGESGLRGYSTCEAATNYEFRSARSACANAAGTDVLVPRRPTKKRKGTSLLTPICALDDVTPSGF